MAKLSDIKGFTVQTVSTDPVASQIAGGSWSAGGNLPAARDECAGGGTLTAGIQFGGYDPPGSAYKPETFEYNGTAWTEGGDMSNARSNFGGLGTQTAALAVGGQNPGLSPYPFNGSEEYNGSSWTSGGTLPGGFDGNYGCTGTQTAGLQIGGTLNPNTKQVKTLSYNGTSWSDTGHDVPTALDRNGATGTSTAAMTGGGRAPSATNAFNIYNGSSWTSITNYPASGYHFQLQGPYTDVIASGGYPLNTNANWWDGTSWTTAPSMSNNHGQAAHANSTAGATSGDGFVAGADPSGFNGTEHWNSAPPVFAKSTEGQLFFNSTANAFKETQTNIPGATWASAPNLNTPGTNGAGGTSGTQTACITFAGDRPSRSVIAEQFDGSSWSEVGDLSTGRNNLGGAGTSTSAVGFGGGTPSYTGATEEWNNTSWSEEADLNSARQTTGAGVSKDSALACAGYDPGAVTGKTEEWNGTAWTVKSPMLTARYIVNCTGTTTALLGAGGQPHNASVESWNGTTWSETTDLGTAKSGGYNSGTQTSALYSGGNISPGNIANCEFWNGSSWTEVADLGTAKNVGGNCGAGTSAAAIIYTGTGPGNQTEEFTASLSNKTITAS